MAQKQGYIFEKATAEDIPAVYSLYKNVIGEKFCVWNDCYPSMEKIRTDLATGGLYVLRDGHIIAGAISIVPENELDAFFEPRHKLQYCAEIARVVVSREYRERGLGGIMIAEIAAVLYYAGAKEIHLSVAKSNLPAIKTYIKAGFITVGEAELYGNDYYLMLKDIGA